LQAQVIGAKAVAKERKKVFKMQPHQSFPVPHALFHSRHEKKNWGSKLRLTLVEKYQRSNVDLTLNFFSSTLLIGQF
jgi:hypothetical protein